MLFLRLAFLTTVLLFCGLFAEDKEIYGLKGSTVELTCPLQATSGGWLSWSHKESNGTLTLLSINNVINKDSLQPEYHSRLEIVAGQTSGMYNLIIKDIRERDEGLYRCNTEIGNQIYQTLFLISSPSNINIDGLTGSNKLVGTEDTDFPVSCTASGGKPPPLVTLMIDGNIVASNYQSVQHTIDSISRNLDLKEVRCEAKNEANAGHPINKSAAIYLNLKPTLPTMSPDVVSINENERFTVTCTSVGSRPAAVIYWTIGTINVTSNSSTLTTPSAGETYSVTSTLTYIVGRSYNTKTITCKVINVALPSGNQTSQILDVKYPPDVSVNNITYDPTIANRTVRCNPVGNPPSYTFYKWQHKSYYGEFIRELEGDTNGVLTLPDVSELERYQDTGKYICHVSNGIKDKADNLKQSASGYVTVNGRPVITKDNEDNLLYGEIYKTVDIYVYLYSVPIYTTYIWFKRNSQLPASSTKYSSFITPAIVNDTFHGHMVQLNGYRATLKIKDLKEEDFNTTYSVKVTNGFGSFIFEILLQSASAPETPLNFTVIDSTSSSIVIGWLPGYDGGNDQTFFIEYRKQNISDEWSLRRISTSYQKSDSIAYTIQDLQSNTNYELRMYAQNKFGNSNLTTVLKVQTLPSLKAERASMVGVIGGVSVGVLGFILILIIVAVILFKKRKGRSDESKVEDELIENILYQSQPLDYKNPQCSAEITNTEKPTDVYAEVKKPSTLYAKVDRKERDLKGNAIKEKKQLAKKKKKGSKKTSDSQRDFSKAGFPLENLETEYANSDDRNDTSNNFINADGLQYAELDLSCPTKNQKGKHVIHGAENSTVYADVDHSKKAPPPPKESEYEETNIRQGKPS